MDKTDGRETALVSVDHKPNIAGVMNVAPYLARTMFSLKPPLQLHSMNSPPPRHAGNFSLLRPRIKTGVGKHPGCAFEAHSSEKEEYLTVRRQL